MKFKYVLLHPRQAALLRRWGRQTELAGFSGVRIRRSYEARQAFVELSWRAGTKEKSDPFSIYSRCNWSELEETIRQVEEGELPDRIHDFLNSSTQH